MIASNAAFDALPPAHQLAAVRREGHFLATRNQFELRVSLYQLHGQYLVEVYYSTKTNEALRAYAHDLAACAVFDDYVAGLALPG